MPVFDGTFYGIALSFCLRLSGRLSGRILQRDTICHHDKREMSFVNSMSEFKVKLCPYKQEQLDTDWIIKVKTTNTFLLLDQKVNAVCWHVSDDNLVPSIACDLQVIHNGGDISI